MPGAVVSGTLSFDGRATLGDFVGTTDSARGVMTGGAGLAEVRGYVEARVVTLVTGNGKRDRDLNKSMESDKYPLIRFDLDRTEVVLVGQDTAAVLLHGRLAIHGVEREVALAARLRFETDGVIALESDFPLNLKDHRIGGLSKMLGLLKMHPDIVVHVRLRFRPSVTGAAGPAGAVPIETPPSRD